MPYLTVGRDAGDIEIYFEDHGVGKAVVLIHGYPLSGRSWEKQMTALLDAGLRVITYDRRGFGQSSQTSMGYNYDVFSEDLCKLTRHLNLKSFSLVGFSMGGGEVARFLGRFGSTNVERAVFISAVPPFLLKSEENSGGVDASMSLEMETAAKKDRLAFLTSFLESFYNADALLGSRLSEEDLRYAWQIGSMASPIGMVSCIKTWWTDFRADVAKISVPTLIVHGDADRILPIDGTARPLQKAIRGSRLAVIEGAPHGLLTTHADEVNKLLVNFLR